MNENPLDAVKLTSAAETAGQSAPQVACGALEHVQRRFRWILPRELSPRWCANGAAEQATLLSAPIPESNLAQSRKKFSFF